MLSSLVHPYFSLCRRYAAGLLSLGLMVMVFSILFLPEALAAPVPEGTCSNSAAFATPPPSSGNGLVSTIAINIQTILNSISSAMFNTITSDGLFRYAINGLLTLYIAIYGILFTFGMAKDTLYDFTIRMIKIGIVALLLSGTAWAFFVNHVVYFFNAGTDDIITQITAITVGGTATGSAPFALLDDAIGLAVSAKMAVTLGAVFLTGPYGWMFGIVMLMAIGTFFKAVMHALWVYLMSLVLKSLLFGVAPIFLACLLFNRTKNIFDGWLNQVVNASLQPILLFAFFGFFVSLISACLSNLLVRPVCWTEWSESMRGSSVSDFYWRFTSMSGNTAGDIWDFAGALSSGEAFPIDLLTVLIFLILAELAGRFNHIVIDLARELAGASTTLMMDDRSTKGLLGSPGQQSMRKALDKTRMNATRTAKPRTGGRAGGARGPGSFAKSGMVGDFGKPDDYSSRLGNQIGRRPGSSSGNSIA